MAPVPKTTMHMITAMNELPRSDKVPLGVVGNAVIFGVVGIAVASGPVVGATVVAGPT